MNKAKKIIIKAFQREKRKERGLRTITPNDELAKAHIKKARHNLTVMNDLNDLGHTDWLVVVAYYAMYHGSTAILARIGLDSKDHATTTAVLEYFFSEYIDNELLKKFNELKEKKENLERLIIDDKFLNYLWSSKNLRETAQYGTSTFITKSEESISHAKEFILKIRSLLEKLDEDYVKMLVEQIKELCNQLPF
ncbi:MAG: HEPN domain-containing protein [Nanoarchaeota archaeon]